MKAHVECGPIRIREIALYCDNAVSRRRPKRWQTLTPPPSTVQHGKRNICACRQPPSPNAEKSLNTALHGESQPLCREGAVLPAYIPSAFAVYGGGTSPFLRICPSSGSAAAVMDAARARATFAAAGPSFRAAE